MKSKIFEIKDHSVNSDWINPVWRECRTRKPNLDRFMPKAQERISREVKLQRLQHVSHLRGMELYEAVDRDRLPKSHHTFQGFINQNASTEITTQKDVLVDWNLPIKLQVVYLPDQIM